VVVINRSTINSAFNLPNQCIQTINANVELSTWTFEDAMAFAEGELAMAA